MIIRVVNALVFKVEVFNFVNSKIYDFEYEISLQRETCVVCNGPVVVKLDEYFIILEAFDDPLNHREVVRSAYVIFESVQHHILNKVQLQHPLLHHFD